MKYNGPWPRLNFMNKLWIEFVIFKDISHSVLSTLSSSPCSNLPFPWHNSHTGLMAYSKTSQCYSWDLENPCTSTISLHLSWNSCLHFTISSSLVTQSTGWNYSHHLSQLPLPWIPRSKWLFPRDDVSPQMAILGLPAQYHLLYVDLKLTSSGLFCGSSSFLILLVNLLCPCGISFAIYILSTANLCSLPISSFSHLHIVDISYLVSCWCDSQEYNYTHQNSSPRLNSPAAILMGGSDTSINPLAQAEILEPSNLFSGPLSVFSVCLKRATKPDG